MDDIEKVSKHAYLIIAHNNFNQLKLLIELLDDVRNDIYLHIGKDAKNIDLKEFIKICKHANVYLANERLTGCWGDRSLVDITMLLLKQATNTYQYEYYHLLSGVDLPIKSQDYIHNFFSNNSGYEFVHFVREMDLDPSYRDRIEERVRYYHLFLPLQHFRKCKGGIKKVGLFSHSAMNGLSIRMQKLIKINRLSKYEFTIFYGSQWFSITNNFALYLLEKLPIINDMIKYSLCSDEIVIQTIIMNSPFKEGISPYSYMRHIDWNRGEPYTFRNSDLDELLQSDKLFARKFDENTDMEIINKIYNHLQQNL